jgi:hypothetical protein
MSTLQSAIDDALGRAHRDNEVSPSTGGVAGNAALTAWTGLLLLVLFAAEGFTLLSIRGLLTWHIAIGALLIPPALLKMGSTGWRMISYYAHRTAYVKSGPPPMVFRLLGPLVVLTSVALLASGVLLILVGESASRTEFFSFLGFRIDWIFVHQVSFFAWVAAMTLHVLGRTIPAFQIAGDRVRRPRAIPGIGRRLTALGAVIALGIGCAFLLVDADSSWRHDSRHDFQGHQRASTDGAVSVLFELSGKAPVHQG